MKLSNLKQKLEKNNEKFNETKIRKLYLDKKKAKKILKKNYDLDKIKIIGITGSCGKSTVAYVLHHYLKELGYKSVLYSSVMVDSPATYKNRDESIEVSISSADDLYEIIKELEYYEPEFLILEVNDSAIHKGLVDEIPFDVRVLTNLNPRHNLEQFTEAEYVDIKKSFFRNVDEKCKCVIGLQDYDKKLFDEFMVLNNCETFTFTTNYIANMKGVDPKLFTALLNELKIDKNGLNMKFNLNTETHSLESNMMMNYNALNLLCVITILNALGLYNNQYFQKIVRNMVIPGRSEVIKINQRFIIIDPHLPNVLENLDNLKKDGVINHIRVVIGSMGYGFKNWEERFNSGKHYQLKSESRKFAMSLLNAYADTVYLTENDNATENVLDICNELKSYLRDTMRSVIITDREKAIEQALIESEIGDVIFISGRGNRRIFCNSEDTMKLFKDREVVEKVMKKLGW